MKNAVLSARPRQYWLVRWLLLGLILLAFARLVFRPDHKSLWWDESLSLQRAESSWRALVSGQIVLDDGLTAIATTDQHPFAYFVLLGSFIRLAGQSVMALRFPSAIAATLLAPMAWAFARLAARRRLLPQATPLWAALFTAVNPFYLWYGREARMYALVALLALLSTYLLLRWSAAEPGPRARRYLSGYGLAAVTLLSTHYLAVLVLPVHAALMFQALWSRSRRRALAAAGGMLALSLGLGALAAWLILSKPGGGTNFAPVSLHTLAMDLLNAFSLGLSVDLAQVRWLDYGFGAVVVLGALWWLRPGRKPARQAWLLPALLVVPVIAIQIVQRFQPAYMNARHMSMVSGFFVLLLSGGVAALWGYRRWAGAAAAVLLCAGMVYSSANYFVAPRYAKDNFTEPGAELAAEFQPGDALVLIPAEMSRLYRYYLPVDLIGGDRPRSEWQGAPLLGASLEATEARLQALLTQHRRTWVVVSGMVPLNPLQGAAEQWFYSHAWLARESGYLSNTILKVKLYLPQAPVLPAVPAPVQQRTDVAFGDKVRLAGYEIGSALDPAGSIPVTLYWQPVQTLDRRFKYILRLLADDGAGGTVTLAISEREPYDGILPTTQWQPGQTILEYTGLTPSEPGRIASGAGLHLALQVYDAETLGKLPVTHADGRAALADPETLLLPFEPSGSDR